MAAAAGYKRLIAGFLLAIVFTVPLAVYQGTFNPALLKISLTQLFLLIILAIWFHRALIRSKGLTLLRSSLDWPLFFFLALALISLFNSPYRWAGGPAISRLVTYLLLYGLAVNIIRDRRSLNRLVGVWLLSTGLASLYGLYQHFFTGITPPRSTFGNPNFFAAYLVLLFPLALALLVNSIFSSRNYRGKMRKHWLKIISLAALLLIMTLALFLVSSRGAWLGLGFGLISLGWLSCLGMKRRWLAARVIPAFLLLLLTLTAFLLPRFLEKELVREEIEKGTAGIRMLIWEGTVRMIAARPFLGSGLGSFRVAYPKHRLPEYFRNPLAVDATAHAHNEFLQIAAEIGIPGLVAFLWILIVFFRKGIELVRKEEDGSKRVLIIGLISGVAGLLVINLVGVNLRFPSSAIFFWLILGLVMGQSAIARAAKAKCQSSKKVSECQSVRVSECQSSRAAEQQLSAVYSWLGVTKLSLPWRRVIFGFALLLMLGVSWLVVGRPFLAERHFRRGVNYCWAGDWERAISQYHKAVKLNPFFIEVSYRMGFAYAAIGDLNKAIAAYERVIDLAPDFARIQANIAFLYQKRGEWDKAIRAYQRALELNPYDITARYHLQKIYGL